MRAPDTAVSFEEFVHARSGSLLRTALLLTGQNRAEAEDLLQGALETTAHPTAQIGTWHPGAVRLRVRRISVPPGMTVVLGPYG